MTETNNTGLAALLESRLMTWEQSRKTQEKKMLELYQDVMRIPRDGDTKGAGAAKARKASGIFVGSTRNKVRAARAKINDALFGNGLMPFDTTPTNEELAPFSDVVEDIVNEQLERMNFRPLLKAGTNTLATYGTGFIFGPFVRKECITETQADNSLGYTQIKESKYEYDFPYFELGNTLDVYPDPEARNLKDGLGVFWTTMESPHTVEAWKRDKTYSSITEALVGSADNGNETGSERAGQLRGNVEFWHKNNRIKVARFFGKVPKRMLKNTEPDSAEMDSGEMVNAVVIMAGGVVVKVSESPYGDKLPALRCAYEDVEHEMWGVGPAENNSPHQKVSNAAFRLFLEGKGMALLGTKSVDRSMFMPTEDFAKYPGKVYQMKPGLSPDERKTAIMDHLEPDITGGWMDVIRMSEQFSDDDTGITKYTQGDDSSNLNKTAAGISMIMSASSLPIKEVIQNIDENWVEAIIEFIIEWNLKFLEVETVRKIHGEEHAQQWEQIKQFGKSSFMSWQATGTSSFMQKEVLTSKLRAFSDFAMSNPQTAQKIDVTELLQQTWDVMEIGRESPILKEDDGKKPNPQLEEMKAQIQQMDQVIQGMTQEIESKDDERDNARRKLDIEEYKARTDRMKVVAPAMDQEQIQLMVMQAITDAMQPYTEQEPQEPQEPPEPMQEQQEQFEPPPEHEMPDGQMMLAQDMQPEQPADAGFLMPEDGALTGEPQ